MCILRRCSGYHGLLQHSRFTRENRQQNRLKIIWLNHRFSGLRRFNAALVPALECCFQYFFCCFSHVFHGYLLMIAAFSTALKQSRLHSAAARPNSTKYRQTRRPARRGAWRPPPARRYRLWPSESRLGGSGGGCFGNRAGWLACRCGGRGVLRSGGGFCL